MLVDRTAYLLSLFHLLGAASILLILLPLYVWRNYLKTKSYTFRFVFAVLVQNTFLVNLVLLLGFFGICNRLTVLLGMAVLYIPVSWHFSDKQFFSRWHKRLEALMQVFHGNKQVFTLRQDIRRWFKGCWLQLKALPFWKHLWHNLPEYLFLLAIVSYNIWFLSYNVLEYHSSQFSDIPVHHSWVYALDKGTLFVDGIYPFAMHAIIYLLHKLFFLDIREALLYFGVFQTVLLVLSIHFFSKAIFRWKYGAVVASTCFSLMLTQGRYAAALPQECGVFALVLIGWCLVRFFQTPLEKHTIKGDSPLRHAFRIKQYLGGDYLNTDALLFALATSLTIAYHFYTAIAASMLVIAFFAAYSFRMVKKQYWVPIITAGVLGTFIAVAPLMACYAKGIPFQASMNWAMSVIRGETWDDAETRYLQKFEDVLEEDSDSMADETLDLQVDDELRSLSETVLVYYNAVYDFTRIAMIGDELTDLLVVCMALSAALGGALLLFRKTRLAGAGYLAIVFYVVLLGIMGAAEALDIFVLMGASRSVTFAEPILFIVYAIPFDLVFRCLSQFKNRIYQWLLEVASVALCIGVVWVIFQFGWVHDFFDVNLAYYNEPVYLTKQIRKTYPPKSFTIVSTVEELYFVRDYGFHENLSKFVNMIDGNEKEFKLPTPYVFFFIEKRVMADYYRGRVYVSPEYAKEDFVYYASSQDYYFQRAIIESKAYYWALEFQRMYPNSFKVYFENDIYVVFMLEQNPYSLYNLQIDYMLSLD